MTLQPPAQPVWSPPQLLRLETEWRRLQRSFACHPFVQITSLAGDPPAEFQVQYKVRTLAFNQQNQLTYVTGCPIHIWLPPQFPHAPPAVRPMAPIFHPNMTMEWIYLPVPWHPNMSLEQVVTVVGQLLGYQTWDPNQSANPGAMEWLAENAHLCPTDPAADFRAEAGGGPLDRISRLGAEQLTQIRTRVKRMCDRLVLVPPPNPQEVRRFAQQIRHNVAVFAEPDVPEALRSSAADLDEVAASMLEPHSAWDTLGNAFASTQAAALAAENAAQAVDAMRDAQRSLGELAPATPDGQSPTGALNALPPMSDLQPRMLNLRRAVRTTEQKTDLLGDHAAALEGAAPPVMNATSGGMLHERLATEAARAREMAAAAKLRVAEVTAHAGPALAEGRRELAVVERVADWAEYSELLRRADETIERISAAGPAGIQSYMLDIGGKLKGPFEYEQRLDDSIGLRYAVSNLGTSAIDLIDTRSGVVIAHADAGEVSTTVKGKGDQPVTIRVRPNAHQEELRVQFEYVVTQSKEKFTKLSVLPEIPGTTSWLGERESFFRSPAARVALAEDNKARRQRWKGVLLDLGALAKFKLRLSTYFLLERVADLVPRVQAEIAKSHDRLESANKRLAEIVAKASRDLQTEQLVIPAKFVNEYSERTAERDRAVRDIPRFEKLLQNAAGQVRLRLSSPRLTGAAGLPAFYVLPPLAEHWADFDTVLSDADLLARVEQLEQALGAKLKPEGKPILGVAPNRPAPPSAASAVPQGPAGAILRTPPVPPAGPLRAGPPPLVAAAAAGVAAGVPADEPGDATADAEVPGHAHAAFVETDEPTEYAGQSEFVEASDHPESAADDPFAVIEDDPEHE